eukprot:185685-Rhodomonas_salina.1
MIRTREGGGRREAGSEERKQARAEAWRVSEGGGKRESTPEGRGRREEREREREQYHAPDLAPLLRLHAVHAAHLHAAYALRVSIRGQTGQQTDGAAHSASRRACCGR